MRYLSTKIIITIAAIILFIVFVGIIIISVNKPAQIVDTIPTPKPIITPISREKVLPPVIKTAPTLPVSQGGGLNPNSAIVKGSTAEIQKLSTHLPYSIDFSSSNGLGLSILIPRQSLQTNTWTLTAQIYGINYNTSPDQPDYENMKKSFKEAADRVFTWVRQNGADPNKIIFIWGDRRYIQDQAERWLKS